MPANPISNAYKQKVDATTTQMKAGKMTAGTKTGPAVKSRKSGVTVAKTGGKRGGY